MLMAQRDPLFTLLYGVLPALLCGTMGDGLHAGKILCLPRLGLDVHLLFLDRGRGTGLLCGCGFRG